MARHSRLFRPRHGRGDTEESVRAMEAERVADAFEHAARFYDLLVAANPGYHRQLRISARRLRLDHEGAGRRILDLGCGTGASTAALAQAYPEAEIIAVDSSRGMLDRARRKQWRAGIRFVHARADTLTAGDVGGAVDAAFAAYLLRNCPDADTALTGMHALLMPGGRLVLHEYSVADSSVARFTWTAVCWCIIIPLGRIATGRAELFRYLWRSVVHFDGALRLRKRMSNAGFVDVRTVAVPGWQRGIVHSFLGRVPRIAASR